MCTENVKPDSNGFYEVEDMVMTKESWIEYCKELKSDRNVLDGGEYCLKINFHLNHCKEFAKYSDDQTCTAQPSRMSHFGELPVQMWLVDI